MTAAVTKLPVNSTLEPDANLSQHYTPDPDLNFSSEQTLNSAESVLDYFRNSTLSRAGTAGTRCLLRRDIYLTLAPLIFVFGNVGNGVSFFVLRSGELKKLPMCFYLSVLAVSNLGIHELLLSINKLLRNFLFIKMSFIFKEKPLPVLIVFVVT